eukprot:CAMPEP_0183721870 /NCGR_PEP_ID=MMETSP0737-20130205/13999_1 /TAXON_ID=385413 /ORGANISM="Thalassiosira miniscula, Strain CCMP1093" /LENGTH=488 /DNA_ID=CAMNT_0025951933 /DNA_START=886 /DNA_END=2352 /DNA_ORIENTATION=+
MKIKYLLVGIGAYTASAQLSNTPRRHLRFAKVVTNTTSEAIDFGDDAIENEEVDHFGSFVDETASMSLGLGTTENTAYMVSQPSGSDSIVTSLIRDCSNPKSKSGKKCEPTSSPTLSPTLPPTSYYEYTNDGDECSWQGPAPFEDKSNVAVQFFSLGDTPYDSGCRRCNTCLDEVTGDALASCPYYDCTLKKIDMDQLPVNNTCTYEGTQYKCNKNNLIPDMNRIIDAGDAAFVVHAGDIIKGDRFASNRRCQEHSLASRRQLYEACTNFLLVAGDNDWNECYGYDINNNTDRMREVWRNYFADSNSTFNQFSKNFPPTFNFTGDSKPEIFRKTDNTEIYHFTHNDVAFFGLNRVAGESYISDRAPVDLNAEWVEQRLALDVDCELKSIVIVAHAVVKSIVYDKINEYFESCGDEYVLPVLTINGNLHPDEYCLAKNETRLELTMEAFNAGPLCVSVVRDPDGEAGDFFHVSDCRTRKSKKKCPSIDW